MALNTPKRIKTIKTYTSNPGNEYGTIWRDYNGDGSSNNYTNTNNGSESPVSSCDSPEFSARHNASAGFGSHGADARENRRGRPRSEALTTLMIEGSTSPSAIKCSYCNRVFPREKSLQAHLRTHTGERPYLCDYPGCNRAFTQSGQLKTHLRLHTGERPFMCSAPSCSMRFTHANRHCPEHPYDQLKRCDDFVMQAVTEQNHEVIKWLEKYKMEKEDRTPTRKTPKRTRTLCDTTANEKNENININDDDENNYQFPVTPSNPYKSRKGLMMELDMNAGLGTSPLAGGKMKPTPKVIHWQEPFQEEDSADECEISNRSTFNPKKRWLREAWQDDLAKPLDSYNHTNHISSTLQLNQYRQLDLLSDSTKVLSPPPPPPPPLSSFSSSSVVSTNAISSHINPNQMRPTVLMVASKDKAIPLLNINNANDNNSSLSESRCNSAEDVNSQPYLATSNHSSDHNVTTNPQINDEQCSIYSNISSHDWTASSPQSPPTNNSSISSKLPNSSTLLTPVDSSDNNFCNISNNSIQSADSPYNESIKNRKWLGALALIQLATDDNNSPISTSFGSSSSLLSSSTSSSSSSSASSSSSSPSMSSLAVINYNKFDNTSDSVSRMKSSSYTEL